MSRDYNMSTSTSTSTSTNHNINHNINHNTAASTRNAATTTTRRGRKGRKGRTRVGLETRHVSSPLVCFFYILFLFFTNISTTTTTSTSCRVTSPPSHETRVGGELSPLPPHHPPLPRQLPSLARNASRRAALSPAHQTSLAPAPPSLETRVGGASFLFFYHTRARDASRALVSFFFFFFSPFYPTSRRIFASRWSFFSFFFCFTPPRDAFSRLECLFILFSFF